MASTSSGRGTMAATSGRKAQRLECSFHHYKHISCFIIKYKNNQTERIFEITTIGPTESAESTTGQKIENWGFHLNTIR